MTKTEFEAQMSWNQLTQEEIFYRAKIPGSEWLTDLLFYEEKLNPFEHAFCHTFFVRRYVPSQRFPGDYRLFFQNIYNLNAGMCTISSLQTLLGVGKASLLFFLAVFSPTFTHPCAQIYVCIGSTSTLVGGDISALGWN